MHELRLPMCEHSGMNRTVRVGRHTSVNPEALGLAVGSRHFLNISLSRNTF